MKNKLLLWPFLNLFLFLFLFSSFPCFSQLTVDHNHFRPGDILIKQQVEFVDPGQPGRNVLWDFSKPQIINQEYNLTYSFLPIEGDSVYIMGNERFRPKKSINNQLIVALEHNTMYYYRLSGDTLLQLGHENPSIRLEYKLPMVQMIFPLNYGQAVTSPYKSYGLYSGTVAMRGQGITTITADAYGSIILPSGDTLNPVLRIKTVQTIMDISNEYSYNAHGNNKGRQVEIYRWYSKGYRYPVFETISSISLEDNAQVFATAFFYPPQDHLYLNSDPENQALLDELWKEASQDQTATQDQNKVVSLEDILQCRIYPNPVSTVLNLEYTVMQEAEVAFKLYSIEGLLIRKIKAQRKTPGTYSKTMECTGLHPKNYVLRIIANDMTADEIIIKK